MALRTTTSDTVCGGATEHQELGLPNPLGTPKFAPSPGTIKDAEWARFGVCGGTRHLEQGLFDPIDRPRSRLPPARADIAKLVPLMMARRNAVAVNTPGSWRPVISRMAMSRPTAGLTTQNWYTQICSRRSMRLQAGPARFMAQEARRSLVSQRRAPVRALKRIKTRTRQAGGRSRRGPAAAAAATGGGAPHRGSLPAAPS